MQAIKNYFNSGATKSYEFRKQQLLLLQSTIKKYESEISEALHQDLGKSKAEAYTTETGMVLTEIRLMLKDLKKWMQPKSVATNLMNLPSTSKMYYDPLGVVFIISPWNYPFQLLFTPLVGAIAGGNCVVLKPSEYTPATTAITEKIIHEVFDTNYIRVVTGDGAVVVPQLMHEFRFDHVFFTGSIAVGKAVYQLAAKDLVPVTLELGGKSPCVIEADANLKVAANRIAIGKFLNAGQTCIAPDYLLIHASVKDQFLQFLKESIASFYTKEAVTSEDYGRIINAKRFDTLLSYLQQGTIVYGGKYDKENLFIEPTILDNVNVNSTIMTEEIFGPVLPVFTFNTKAEAVELINKNSNPLSFYVFTSSIKKEEDWLQTIPFGGGCVNNTVYHFANDNLHFGGIGNSGIGSYHGKQSFYTFTHAKPVMKTPTWLDPAIKYPPFKNKLKWIKLLLR